MKKVFVKIFMAIFLTLALLFFGRDILVKAAAGNVCRAATGLRLSIGSFHSNLFSSSLDIRNLKIFNQPSFSEKIMLEMPEVYVQCDPASLFSGKPRLKELRLHLAFLRIERNKEGKLNLAQLKPTGAKKDQQQTASPSQAPKVRIDLFKLKIDKVVYKDFSKAIPTTREFTLNIDETYRNIQDVRALTPIIVSNALRNQALRALTNFSAQDLLRGFQDSGVNIADFGLEKVSGVLDSGLGQTAQGIVGSVTDQLEGLFGSPSRKS